MPKDGPEKDAFLRPDLMAQRVVENEGMKRVWGNKEKDGLWWKDVKLCAEVKDRIQEQHEFYISEQPNVTSEGQAPSNIIGGEDYLTDDQSTVNSVIFPDDAKFHMEWKGLGRQFDTKGQQSQSDPASLGGSEPEQRAHVRLLISTEGGPLKDARNPKELLQAVMHAMIGYWVLFKDGWLHRDVSIGNVLLMKTPEKRDEIEGLDNILTEDIRAKYFNECLGFISDADLAIRWTEGSWEVPKGTPPFMSCTSFKNMTLNIENLYTAVDDLESFIWVMFWAILSIMEMHKVAFTSLEQIYWDCPRSHDPIELNQRRCFHSILDDQYQALQRQQEGMEPVRNEPSPAFAPYVKLLLEWLEFAFSRKMRELISPNDLPNEAKHKRIVGTLLCDYLSIGVKHLETLPNDWEYMSK
ncbi:hypothetical protein Clacol_001968 [Clathrus columnatus]|uniref:Fungal-type protein kinase domain-containing protein n=1 Tax=Clathrus columnatus TaxID=1419009 RepID=A0AAV5A3H8_9AGAM|nr:hypothetical protein Clacol_001968 [Clathrus columnatus]